MHPLLHTYKAQALTLLFVWLIAMIFSAEIVLSLSMILLCVLAVFQLYWTERGPQLGLRAALHDNLRLLWKHDHYVVVTLPFFLVLLSATYSGDVDYTLQRLQVKLPFLVLPLAFLSMPRFSRREFNGFLYFFVLLMVIACLYVGLQYLADFEAVNKAMSRGKAMPTPSNHIRFSLCVALAILAGGALVQQGFRWRARWERGLLVGCTAFLFVFIHLLSVRSGLVSLYLALGYLAVYWIATSRRWVLGTALLLMLAALPYTAYRLLPSFQSKIDYMRWDLDQYRQGSGAQYSDSERLLSLQLGWEVAQENPLFGVGAGDLRQRMQEVYRARLGPEHAPRMPHNQFLTTLAGTGYIGLGLLLLALLFPLLAKGHYRQPFFLAFHIVILTSCLIENTFENNFGISIYLLFLLLGMHQLDRARQDWQLRSNLRTLQPRKRRSA